MLPFGPLRSDEQFCPYFGRVVMLPPSAPSAIPFIPQQFCSVVQSLGSVKRFMLFDVHQRRLWGYGTMDGTEEASSAVISMCMALV